jgi:hypothetical protein
MKILKPKSEEQILINHVELKCQEVPYPIYSKPFSQAKINSIKRFFKSVVEEVSLSLHYNIWFTGSSGACLVSMFQVLCPKESSSFNFVAIRKDNEDSHHWSWKYEIEAVNKQSFGYNIFLDDCIATGATLAKVISHLSLGKTFDEVWILSEIQEDRLETLINLKVKKCISIKN